MIKDISIIIDNISIFNHCSVTPVLNSINAQVTVYEYLLRISSWFSAEYGQEYTNDLLTYCMCLINHWLLIRPENQLTHSNKHMILAISIYLSHKYLEDDQKLDTFMAFIFGFDADLLGKAELELFRLLDYTLPNLTTFDLLCAREIISGLAKNAQLTSGKYDGPSFGEYLCDLVSSVSSNFSIDCESISKSPL